VSEALDKITEQIARYAEAKAQRVYLEHFRKTKKALLMKQAEVNGSKTNAEQEREAYAHKDYQEVLAGLQASTEIEAREYWELKLLEMRFDKWKEMEATKRAEMRL
jgi:hypothetical protein